MVTHNFMRAQHLTSRTHPLTHEQIRESVPSVFAETAWKDTSAQYRQLSTVKVLDALSTAGFVPWSARQGGSRIEDKYLFTKHLVTLRVTNGPIYTNPRVGTLTPQLLILNSSDRSSSFGVSAGLFRLVCSNGLMVSATSFGTVHKRHSGLTNIESIIEESLAIAKSFPAMLERIEHFQTIQLSADQRLNFATAALAMRYGNSDKVPYTADRLLITRRYADKENSWNLFGVLNTVQENITQSAHRRGNFERSSRAVGLDLDMKLNTGLWALADSYAGVA